jgi:hypothetical protein
VIFYHTCAQQQQGDARQARVRRCPTEPSLNTSLKHTAIKLNTIKTFQNTHTAHVKLTFRSYGITITHFTCTAGVILQRALQASCESCPLSSINIGIGVGQANAQARNHHIGDCATAGHRSVAGSWKLGCCYGNRLIAGEHGDSGTARKQRARERGLL